MFKLETCAREIAPSGVRSLKLAPGPVSFEDNRNALIKYIKKCNEENRSKSVHDKMIKEDHSGSAE